MGFGLIDLCEEPIRDAIGTSQELIEEAHEILRDYGTVSDLEWLRGYDIDYAALDHLEQTINVRDMTNSIINAYFACATGILSEIPFFMERGISFDYYANCDSSDIQVHLTKGNLDSCETYYGGTLTDLVRESMINDAVDTIYPLVEEYLSDTGREYPREWLYSDLEDIDCSGDIENYIKDGELTEDFKETIDREAKDIENERG